MFQEFEKPSVLVEADNIVYSPNSTTRPSFHKQPTMEDILRLQQQLKEMEKRFALDE